MESNKKFMFIDYSAMMYRHIYSSYNEYSASLQQVKNTNSTYMYRIWEKKMIGNIFSPILTFKPDEVVIALDSKTNWRKDIYNRYKENRKSNRDSSAINFQEFFPINDKFIDDLMKVFSNIKILNVDKCEGDDVIGVLVNHLKDDRHVIVASDKDYIQLLKESVVILNPNITEGSNIVTHPNPKEFLEQHILIGDSSDDIPNVLVMDIPLKYDERNIGLGEVTANKMLLEGIDSKSIIKKVSKKYPTLSDNQIKDTIKKNYERNRILIDFNFIPQNIKDSIINKFNSYELKPINSRELYMYLMINGHSSLLDRYDTNKEILLNIGK